MFISIFPIFGPIQITIHSIFVLHANMKIDWMKSDDVIYSTFSFTKTKAADGFCDCTICCNLVDNYFNEIMHQFIVFDVPLKWKPIGSFFVFQSICFLYKCCAKNNAISYAALFIHWIDIGICDGRMLLRIFDSFSILCLM